MPEITVVGSIAFDAVETHAGKRDKILGGAATHFSLASSFFADTHPVGPVGDDFTDAEYAILRGRGVDTSGIVHVEGGKTFFWAGRYHRDVNQRDTLQTDLNVFEHFAPELDEEAASADVVFLANIQPGLQANVRRQCPSPRFTALDSMNLWIDIARDELVEAIGLVDCLVLNDAEIEQLTDEPNLVRAARKVIEDLGPRIVVAKQGEYGATLFTREGDVFSLPAFPVADVVDPTGAGDSFAGGFIGYIASQKGEVTLDVLKTALAYGTAFGSFNVEGFGPERIADLKADEVTERVAALQAMTTFDAGSPQLRG
jgi:cytidine kinase